MLNRVVRTVTILATLLAAGGSVAQTTTPPPSSPSVQAATLQRLATYLRSTEHLQIVGAAIAQFEPTALAATCKQVKPVKGRSWRPLEDPVFDGAAAAPSTASWQETWEVSACGRPGLRSLGFIARPGQGVVPFPMFPGESLADMTLQQDAGQVALDVAAPGTLNCAEGQIQVINSTVTNRTNYARGQWSERWTVAGCQKTADIDVDFTPGPGGRPAYAFRTGKPR
jgi:hypothetical protein